MNWKLNEKYLQRTIWCIYLVGYAITCKKTGIKYRKKKHETDVAKRNNLIKFESKKRKKKWNRKLRKIFVYLFVDIPICWVRLWSLVFLNSFFFIVGAFFSLFLSLFLVLIFHFHLLIATTTTCVHRRVHWCAFLHLINLKRIGKLSHKYCNPITDVVVVVVVVIANMQLKHYYHYHCYPHCWKNKKDREQYRRVLLLPR